MLSSSSTKDLPTDIVNHILSRLPVKSLLISTSVAKSWYSLIKSPNFINTHLTKSKNCNFLLMPQKIDMFGGMYYFTNASFNSHYDMLVYRYFDMDNQYMTKQLVGSSCNGLLCLNYYPYPFVDLVNPSIRKGKSLPGSVIVPKFDAMSFSVYELIVGFGYHGQSNDYKVVRIFYFKKDSGFVVLDPEVEVYSLLADSWRRVDVIVDFFACRESVVFVNGGIHWIAKEFNGYDIMRDFDVGSEYEFIVSFDIVDEVFRRMELPVNCLYGYHVHPFLMNYKESLCLVVYFAYAEDAVERFFSIWVMREYGVADSWTKECTFLLSGSGYVQRPLGFTDSGKLIYEKSDRELGMFDLNSFDLESLQLEELQIDSGAYVIDASYTESLVLLEERSVELLVEN